MNTTSPTSSIPPPPNSSLKLSEMQRKRGWRIEKLNGVFYKVLRNENLRKTLTR